MLIDLTDICITDYESQIVTDEASGINIDAGDDDDFAFITCEVADIRYRVDGGDPVQNADPALASGHILEKDKYALVLGNRASIKNFRAIREAGNDAILRISYGL